MIKPHQEEDLNTSENPLCLFLTTDIVTDKKLSKEKGKRKQRLEREKVEALHKERNKERKIWLSLC